MIPTGRHRRRRRAVATALCVALAASDCATYAPRAGPPVAVLARERPTAVRVTLRDGRTIEVFEPALRVEVNAATPDTVLAGLVFNRARGRREPIALPLRDVVTLDARVANRVANDRIMIAFGVAFYTVAAFFLFIITACGDRGCD